MKDLSKKKLGILAALLAIALSGLAIANPFKVTDPSDPRFDPDKFSFNDYSGRSELIGVYEKLFPIGTPKEFVDRVLVNAGGAYCAQQKTFPQLWYCRQPKDLKHWDGAPHFLLIYDKNLKLANINPNGLGEIYPTSITYEDLEKEYKDKAGIK